MRDSIIPLCDIFLHLIQPCLLHRFLQGGGYYHMLSGSHRGCFPVRQWSTLCCNPLSVRNMRRVSTHISNPKRRTAYTTTLENVLDVRKSAPSLPRILNIRAPLFHDLRRLETTTGQSLPESVSLRPRYLKYVTVVSGRKYALNALSVPALESSTNILHRFLSSPLLHWDVLGWRPFRDAHGTRMSKRGNRG